jgi:hypothetical protein
MMMASDVRSLTSLSNEAREAVTAGFDALARWRDETFAANDRCLTKVLDQVAAAHKALGWSDQATAVARDYLLKASKLQAQMIDHVMDAWEQQLKSQNARVFQLPTSSGSAFTDPVSEMMRFGELTLAPCKLWIESAETWQRNLAVTMAGSTLPNPPQKAKKASRTGFRGR